MKPFASLLKAMWKGFARDRAATFFTIVFPLLFLVIFGGIFKSASAPKIHLGVVGPSPMLDQALRSPGLAEMLDIDRSADLDAAKAQVADGDLDAVINEQGNTVEMHYSAADQVKAGTVQAVMSQVVQQANVQASGVPPTYTLQATSVEDSSLKPIQYLTPGLLGWAIASSAVFGASATLVTWRTKGLLRRLRLAPVGAGHILGARVLLSLMISLVQLALFLAVASLPFFGLKLHGSWWLAIPVLLAGTLAFLAIGMLIGGVAKTQESAQAITQLVVLPMAFLGGSFFPLDNAPSWIQHVSRAFPLRYLNDAMLDVIGRGRGVDAIWVPMAVLVGIAATVGAVAMRVFRWER